MAPDTPFALIENNTRGLQIKAANPAAQKHGIACGMPLADARALYSDLIVENSTPEKDYERLKQLAIWHLRYSPLVAVHDPETIILDITGCDHLFGGEAQMLNHISKKLAHFDCTARLAITSTIGSAWAAARYGSNNHPIISSDQTKSFLKPLPVAALRLDDKTIRRLQQLGLHKIETLIEAPLAPLTTRFGVDLVNRLQQAIGERAEPLNPISPPPEYCLRHPFIEPVTQLDALEFTLTTLAEKMSLQLKSIKKGARQLEICLFRVDGHADRIAIGTSRLCHESAHILLLFQEKLSQVGEELDAGFGYDLMTLSAYHVEPLSDTQHTWHDAETKNTEAIDKLLDRFGNRFGPKSIMQFHPIESHIPEHAFHRCRPTLMKHQDRVQHTDTSAKPRPLLLLRPSEPITVLAEVPDGPPIRFQWRRKHHRIIAAEGPERISPEWWQVHMNISQQSRDYYRVEDQDGYRFWLYRDGLHNREQDTPRWFIHGLFS